VTHPGFREQIRTVNLTLKELGVLDKPTLMVFNKIDGLDEKSIIQTLKAEYRHSTFVSGLRSLGLTDLKLDLLELIERDFVEHVVYIPVEDSKTVARIHSLAEVVDEEYIISENGDGEQMAAVRLRLRVSPAQQSVLRDDLDRYASSA